MKIKIVYTFLTFCFVFEARD